MSLFKLRGKLDSSQSLILGIVGFIILIAVWWILAEVFSIEKRVLKNFDTRMESTLGMDSVRAKVYLDSLAKADELAYDNSTETEKVYPLLPPPLEVLKSFPSLYQNDELLSNTWISIWRNIKGYFWAVFICVPIGFLIGLLPIFRGLFSKQVDALRYLPLTALTGLFIIWFGIGEKMKVAFLAFGIIVYLLPVVVQRVDEVKDVYLKTVFTLGATDWQTIRTVYLPSVMSKLMDDIRVLTAISWTYIIIAELLNREGGIGSLIYIKARQGQIAKVFAILIVIIIVGFFQDRIFTYLDKRLFPHKYHKTALRGVTETQYGIYVMLGIILLAIIFGVLFPGFAALTTTILPIVLISGLLLVLYGEYLLFSSKKSETT